MKPYPSDGTRNYDAQVLRKLDQVALFFIIIGFVLFKKVHETRPLSFPRMMLTTY